MTWARVWLFEGRGSAMRSTITARGQTVTPARRSRSRALAACFLRRMVVPYRVWKDEGERAASIATATQKVGATLLHKDPEFRAIVDLPQEWLG